MRIDRLTRPPALALGVAAATLALVSSPGCGESPQDRAAARANEDEQGLLQQKIQQGLAKPPVTKTKRR